MTRALTRTVPSTLGERADASFQAKRLIRTQRRLLLLADLGPVDVPTRAVGAEVEAAAHDVAGPEGPNAPRDAAPRGEDAPHDRAIREDEPTLLGIGANSVI